MKAHARILAAAAIAVLAVVVAEAAAAKPNVVILFADDISPRELPIYGSTVWSKPKGGDTSDPRFRARTPVIDRLASDGCYITNAWGATVCMPSRAMMMTGRFATQTKWWHNRDLGRVQTVRGKRTWYLFESSPIGMGQVATMGGYASVWAGKTQMQVRGEAFQRFGFSEGMIGTGEELEIRRHEYGFRTSVVSVGGERKVKNLDSGRIAPGYPMPRRSYGFNPHLVVVNEKGQKVGLEWWPNTPEAQASFSVNTYGPDVETDYCLDFMERQHRAGKPFLVYHATFLGHGDFDWLNPNSGSKWPGTPVIEWDGESYHRTEPNITGSNGQYETNGTVTESGLHSHVNYIDYIMWRYVEKAKKLGVEDNTIFIFSADNGSYLFGKGRVDQQRGTHVPLIVHAPGMTKRGKQDVLASLTDVVPTLADIMGVAIPDNYAIDGKSLWPYLKSSATQHREWTYGYKSGTQIIRSKNLIRDGKGRWWDASELPHDHTSFKEITGWDRVSLEYRNERKKLEQHLRSKDLYDTHYNAPN
ncbi:Arylsulfatase [Planctomycetes bacterium MalM25]|nr:Arylsulfatase [Planctomycetes bacterium MalM25]